MPRCEIHEIVQDTSGNALSGASVQVNKREGGAATVYSAETGAGTTANPIVTSTNGRIEGWVEGGSYDLVVTPLVGSVYTQRFEAVSGRNNPIISPAAFPTTPADGEDIVVDVGSGCYWTFRYDSDSASAYKWTFVGGGWLYATDIDAFESTAGAHNAYQDLGTVGPTLTIPYAGDWEFFGGAVCDTGSIAAAAQPVAALKVGAAATADAERLAQAYSSAPATVRIQAQSGRRIKRTVSAASTVCKLQYKNAANNNAVSFEYRWLRARPVRITG